MTTLVGIKGDGFVVVGADTQVTTGHMRLPFPYPKISIVGSNIISGCGSVGSLKRILAIALKSIRMDRVEADDVSDMNPGLNQLSKTLAELNFTLPLEYKHFNSFSYLIAGLDSGDKPALMSIGDDGSIIKIPSFYADGSGSDFSFSIISKDYNEKTNNNLIGRDTSKFGYLYEVFQNSKSSNESARTASAETGQEGFEQK